MLRLAFDFIITWRETRTRPNAYGFTSSAYAWIPAPITMSTSNRIYCFIYFFYY